MVFWLAVLAGTLFVWIGVTAKFYEMLVLFFNIVISLYVALFLTPVVLDTIPSAGETPFGHTLSLVAIGLGTFLILYAISYTFLTGTSSVAFPKIFETLFAGLLGFLTGFLLLSVAGLLICLSPISQYHFAKRMGLDAPSQQANISFLCWWCDSVHTLVSYSDTETNSRQAIDELLDRASSAAVIPTSNLSEEAPTEAPE